MEMSATSITPPPHTNVIVPDAPARVRRITHPVPHHPTTVRRQLFVEFENDNPNQQPIARTNHHDFRDLNDAVFHDNPNQI